MFDRSINIVSCQHHISVVGWQIFRFPEWIPQRPRQNAAREKLAPPLGHFFSALGRGYIAVPHEGRNEFENHLG
jgi:hypothetical protein